MSDPKEIFLFHYTGVEKTYKMICFTKIRNNEELFRKTPRLPGAFPFFPKSCFGSVRGMGVCHSMAGCRAV